MFENMSRISAFQRQYRASRLVLTGVLSFAMLLGVSTSRGTEPGSASREDLRALAVQAETAFKERRFQEAVGLYTRAATIAPHESSVFLGRGMAHEMLGQPGKAQDDYQKVLEKDPENYLAMEYLAGIHERGGDKIAEAIELYTRALELDPRPVMKENLAVWIAVLRTRLKEDGESAVAMWNLGNEELARGKLNKAEASYSQAIELNPEMYQAYFSRGLLRMRTREFAAAISDFEAGVSIDPRYPGGWVLKGLALEQAGELEKARRDFELAKEIEPKDPAAHFHLGRIRQAEKDVAGALQAYEAALKLKPKPDLLKLVQERIAAIRAAAEGPGRTVPSTPKDKPTPW